jgi:hypothetical protein
VHAPRAACPLCPGIPRKPPTPHPPPPTLISWNTSWWWPDITKALLSASLASALAPSAYSTRPRARQARQWEGSSASTWPYLSRACAGGGGLLVAGTLGTAPPQ